MSPPLVRLPPRISPGELRLYWDRTDGGACLHADGPCMVTAILDHFGSPKLELAGSMAQNYEVLQAGLVKHGPSLATQLEAAGFDLRTLVFSIRKKDAAPATAEVPDDIRKRIEDAQVALARLREAIGEGAETKGVHVYDEGDMDAMTEAAADMEAALADAFNAIPAAS